MYYSHLDLEKEIGISKNGIDKRLKRLGLGATIKEKGRKLYTEEVLKALKEYKVSKPIEYFRVSCLEYVPYLDKETYVVKHFYPKTKAEAFERECRSYGIKTIKVKWNYGY